MWDTRHDYVKALVPKSLCDISSETLAIVQVSYVSSDSNRLLLTAKWKILSDSPNFCLQKIFDFFIVLQYLPLEVLLS